MRAYKFLEPDGSSIWSGFLWPQPTSAGPGRWVQTDDVRPCHSGIHACRATELSYWMRHELWEVELEGEVVESRHKVVAPRGRLVRRIDDYRSAVRELGAVSAWRVRDRAVVEAAAAGRGELAAALRDSTELGELEAIGAQLIADGSRAAQIAFMASDAAHFAPDGHLEHSPFIAANSAGYVAADFDDGFAAERQFQSDWLVERLGLRP